EDEKLRLWRLPEELSLGPPLPHHQTVFSVALSPDDRVLLTSSKDRARLWSVPDRRPLAEFGSNNPAWNVIRAAALAPDGRTLAFGLWAHGAGLYDLVSPKQLSRLGPPFGKPFKEKDSVLLLAFGRSAKQLLTRRGALGQRVELWQHDRGALELQRAFV